MRGNRICFSQSFDVKTELEKIMRKGYALWCEGLDLGTQKRPHEPFCLMILMMTALLVSHQQRRIKSQHLKSGRMLFKKWQTSYTVNTAVLCSTNYGLKHCTASNTPAGMSHQKNCHGVTAKRINLLSLREEEQCRCDDAFIC